MGVPPPHSRYSRGWSAICDKNCTYRCNFLQIDSSGPRGDNQVQALCGASFAGPRILCRFACRSIRVRAVDVFWCSSSAVLYGSGQFPRLNLVCRE
jgi:hypothetical protein